MPTPKLKAVKATWRHTKSGWQCKLSITASDGECTHTRTIDAPWLNNNSILKSVKKAHNAQLAEHR